MTIVQSISDLKTDHVYKWHLQDDDSIVYEDVGVILNQDPDGTGVSYKSEKDLTWYTSKEAKLSLKDNTLSPTKISLPKSAKTSLIHVGLVPPNKYKYADDGESDPWSKIEIELIEKYDIMRGNVLIGLIPLSKHEILIGGSRNALNVIMNNVKGIWYNAQIFDALSGKIIRLTVQGVPSYNKYNAIIPYFLPNRATSYHRFKIRKNIEDVYLSPYVMLLAGVHSTLLLDEATIVEPEPEVPHPTPDDPYDPGV